MSRGSFVQGTLILAIAGFTSKLLGALYRIPLARLLGAEGMGLYQMAYPIYTMILAVSTAGVPVAISILVSERLAQRDARGAARVFHVALTLMALTGASCSFLVYREAGFLAEKVLYEPRAFYPITAVAPAIFLAAVVSAFRGYFQGYQEMKPTAFSQIFEQLVRVTTVLALAYVLLPEGIEFAAAGATFGAVTGGVAALSVLMLVYWKFNRRTGLFSTTRRVKQEAIGRLVQRIVIIAFPLSIGGIVVPLMQVADATIVPLRLQAAGYTATEAMELFGQLTGMAQTLINLPAIITIALSISLVPAVSQAKALKNDRLVIKRISAALRVTILLVLPAATGLWVLAAPLGMLLYDLKEVGLSLAVLAPGVIFLGLYQVSSGSLQGLGKTYLPVFNLLTGVVVKVWLSYQLTALPQLGIRGAALASVGGFTIAFLLNYVALKKLTGVRIPFKDSLLKPFLAAALMVIIVYWVYGYGQALWGNNRATLAAVLTGALVYGSVLLLVGAVRASDLEHLPKVSQKLIQVLKRLRLVR